MSVETDLRDFILNELKWDGSPKDLTPDLHLIDAEVIDSLGVLEIVAFLEETYDIEIPDEEILEENFDSIGHIAALVESKQSAQ